MHKNTLQYEYTLYYSYMLIYCILYSSTRTCSVSYFTISNGKFGFTFLPTASVQKVTIVKMMLLLATRILISQILVLCSFYDVQTL